MTFKGFNRCLEQSLNGSQTVSFNDLCNPKPSLRALLYSEGVRNRWEIFLFMTFCEFAWSYIWRNAVRACETREHHPAGSGIRRQYRVSDEFATFRLPLQLNNSLPFNTSTLFLHTLLITLELWTEIYGHILQISPLTNFGSSCRKYESSFGSWSTSICGDSDECVYSSKAGKNLNFALWYMAIKREAFLVSALSLFLCLSCLFITTSIPSISISYLSRFCWLSLHLSTEQIPWQLPDLCHRRLLLVISSFSATSGFQTPNAVDGIHSSKHWLNLKSHILGI